MNCNAISPGNKSPKEFNVIIEIPQGGNVKYEIDKESGLLAVDRFLPTAMIYPANYGFIPNTQGQDGDPLDVLVFTTTPIIAGSLIQARPIGILKMEDEAGMDEKILAVPLTKISPYHKEIACPKDLPEIVLQQIQHFFEHYKDLEPGKWVKIMGWGSAEEAETLIIKSIPS